MISTVLALFACDHSYLTVPVLHTKVGLVVFALHCSSEEGPTRVTRLSPVVAVFSCQSPTDLTTSWLVLFLLSTVLPLFGLSLISSNIEREATKIDCRKGHFSRGMHDGGRRRNRMMQNILITVPDLRIVITVGLRIICVQVFLRMCIVIRCYGMRPIMALVLDMLCNNVWRRK